MTLRKKTFLFISMIFTCLIACLLIISLTITSEGYTDIENKEIRRDVERAMNVIENEMNMLDNTVQDFAIWDETYAYIKSGDKAYTRDYLRNSIFAKLRVNYILFVDNAGGIVFGKSFDLKNGGEIPFPKALQQDMAMNSILTRHANSEKSISGIMLFPDGPMIVSSWPILTGDMKGPVRGTLIMGRSLDNFKIRQFARITKLSLVMHQIGDEQIPPDMREAGASLSEETAVMINRLNKDIIAGYALVKDIYGKPALILRVDQPRAVYKQSQTTINYLVASLFIFGVFFTLIAIFLMEKFVLHRLAKLGVDLKKIALAGVSSQRVSAAGSDELSNLAYDINGMLEKLEELEKFKEATNEARYRAVVEEQTELICRYLPDGTTTFANDACCRYFGIEKHNCSELNIISLIPEEYEAFHQRIAAFRPGKPGAIRECQIHQDNDIRWLQWTDRAIFDREGKIVEFQSVGREITELKKVETALHQLVELENLISTISSNFINLASDEIDVGINQALQGIGEHVRADRSSVFLFSADKEKISNTHEWCAEGIKPQINDLQNYVIFKTLPGNAEKMNKHEVFYIPCVADMPPESYQDKLFFEARGIRSLLRVPMVSRGSLIGFLGFDSVNSEKEWSDEIIDVLKIVSTIFVNALERKRTEETLSRTEKSLRQTQKMEAIGTLAGGIAHDFNNILGAIIGYTEMTLYECRDTLVRQRLEQVLKASDRAKDLVKQILTFSRQRDQERMSIDIGMITKEALKLLRSSIPSTIGIVTNISSTPYAVFADPTQIHQILMNLCTNAAHAMREKGGVLKIGLERIDYDAMTLSPNVNLKRGAYVQLAVSDNGHGIDPAIMDRIFDPFFTTKKIGEGTGLGLSVVYGIAQSHGGTISVYSEPEKGTIFKVYLPLIEEIVPDKSIVEEQIPAGNERILFVDDEEVLVAIGQNMLRTLGYDIVAKTSSTEALEAFILEPAGYDLVISDMTMPNMTGVELSREILRVRPDIPIIICTGFSELINEDEAGRLGIQKLLTKPLFLKNLARILREILDKK